MQPVSSADLLLSVVAEKAEPLTASSSSLEVDPLLKDLTEKKLIFKKNVATLAAELKDVRRCLVLQEQSFTKEAHARKVGFDCSFVDQCPQCSKKFRRKEIVNLYAQVIVVPNADLEKEVQCLKKENMSLKIEVGWDESTSGERQPRVSLWEIEPLTTFPMYPSSFPLRLKRPWPSDLPSLHGGRDDLMWLRDGDRAIQSLNFQGFSTNSLSRCCLEHEVVYFNQVAPADWLLPGARLKFVQPARYCKHPAELVQPLGLLPFTSLGTVRLPCVARYQVET
ncbi:hypothetical protein ZIOFF_040120 [Zingiber officinale]|uniref:Uncharacterized protein n=1 Tax=Zingiber officinale TaxID=94328 RepID=A0A8J5L0P8_ZINOF|nr:hypothetical protein ZIOFF_040120 [Zingiber officinale]